MAHDAGGPRGEPSEALLPALIDLLSSARNVRQPAQITAELPPHNFQTIAAGISPGGTVQVSLRGGSPATERVSTVATQKNLASETGNTVLPGLIPAPNSLVAVVELPTSPGLSVAATGTSMHVLETPVSQPSEDRSVVEVVEGTGAAASLEQGSNDCEPALMEEAAEAGEVEEACVGAMNDTTRRCIGCQMNDPVNITSVSQ